jgi:signal peptidase II
MKCFDWRPLALAALVVVADRMSKSWIEAHVDEWRIINVIPGLFQIVHTRNTGIAFGMFQGRDGQGSPLLLAFTLAVIAFLGWMLWSSIRPGSTDHWTNRFGLGLVLGGAAGNLHDRIRWGSVTDFLDFYLGTSHFPVFNLADSAITVGAGLLILGIWLARPAERAA